MPILRLNFGQVKRDFRVISTDVFMLVLLLAFNLRTTEYTECTECFRRKSWRVELELESVG